MTENDKERLARQYAAGEITWRGLRERGFEMAGPARARGNRPFSARTGRIGLPALRLTERAPSLDSVR